jgi:ComEC/Rec2-related protein
MRKWIFALWVGIALFRWQWRETQLRQAQQWCAEGESGAKYQQWRGFPVFRSPTSAQLAGPILLVKDEERAFAGAVWLPKVWRLDFGREVLVSGFGTCAYPLRNPGGVADGLFAWRGPRVRLSESGLSARRAQEPGWFLASSFRGWFLERLRSQFAAHPGLLGLEVAVWTGDASGLPTTLQTFYLEGGLLAVLALSGQHVSALVLLVNALLWPGVRLMRQWFPNVGLNRGWARVHRALPVAGATLLWVTSGGAPSVQRTWAMALAVWALRWRGLWASPIQVAISAVGILMVWDPAMVTSPSFFLSAGATTLTILMFDEVRPRRRWLLYLVSAAVMPILAIPLVAFFFARVSVMASLYNVLLSGIWDLILIPAAFLLPLVIPRQSSGWSTVVLDALETTWGQFAEAHHTIAQLTHGPIYLACPRPTWVELVTLELALLVTWAFVSERVTRRSMR